MNKELLQQLIDGSSHEFRLLYDDNYRREILGVDEEIYHYRNMTIDPHVSITLPEGSSRTQNKAAHDTLIRYYTYPYQKKERTKGIPEGRDKETIRKYNTYVKAFDVMIMDTLNEPRDKLPFPTIDEIKDYLISIGLPTTLESLNVEEIFKLRKEYPYAWLRIDIPDKWKGNTKGLVLQYELYIDIISKTPPLPVSIVLFRGIDTKFPNVGDEIIEYGFSSKSYIYSISDKYAGECCTLIISYPKNHKFHMLQDRTKKELYEVVSYPGEVLLVDKVEAEGDKTNVFCHFIRYEPHMAPDGSIVRPPLTDIFDNAKSYNILVTLSPITY